ncbi:MULTISPECIES: alpha/beta fold hydrolase [Vagococcus]|uniref:Male sterility C-terminal domain n=1 Tax=Vagococcus fluvialis bH819 TaxID=1255619 RepID=A0A1X6WP80_9ENTE|nr:MULTISPECIES: alpha/beta fold hydrolase [Vagococcus]SLM86141.1 Male sterility C-terminal domain [Vagococcus fluvialis bH819]HCM90389.1 NAD-binding protein [Vagococcus sp.]
MNVLIIGATGFIGSELVTQLAKKNINLTLLVRNKEKAHYLKMLNDSKIQLITGDLTLPSLGLNSDDKKIALSCDSIIHCGGPMDIALPKDAAKTAFLNGAKHVSELATEIHKKRGLQQLIHIVGYMSPFNDKQKDWLNYDVFNKMHPLLVNDSYYEQMKFQADILIRQIALQENFPLTVINPPTVIGTKHTGATEQLAGFGLFMKIIRQGLLPVIPGGKNYRLPVIHNDIFVNFVVRALFSKPKKTATYTLVQDKKEDLNLPQLMTLISQSMNMKIPKIIAPMPFLKAIMSLGGSQITGVSKSSLNFITDREFENQQVKKDFPFHLIDELSVNNSLALVVADIDYTLTFGKIGTNSFIRTTLNQTTLYQLEGNGKPIVLIHGLFSDGSDLFPLGRELNKQTNRPIWIIDLPGFGRSPFRPNKEVLEPYLKIIQMIQQETNNEATFVGHSFGAALLLEGLQRDILSSSQQLVLLQPPILKIKKNPPRWLSKILLKSVSTQQLKQYFMKKGFFSKEEKLSEIYFEKVKNSFSSPRILNTNLLINEILHKMIFNKPEINLIPSIWGSKDSSYKQPENFDIKEILPYGHHFPISQPVETAKIISSLI